MIHMSAHVTHIHLPLQDAMQRLEQHLKFFELLRKTCSVQLTMRALEFFQATQPLTHAASVGLANAVELELDAWDCLDHQGRIHMHLMGPDAPATCPTPANPTSPAQRSHPASLAFDYHTCNGRRSRAGAQPQQLFSPLCGLPMLAFADLTHLTLTRVVMRPQDCHALGRNYSLHTLSVSCQMANAAGQILWPGSEWAPMHPELYDENELKTYRLCDTVSRDYPKLIVSDYPEAGFMSCSPGGHLLRSLEKLHRLTSLQLVAEQHPTRTAPVTKRSTAAAARAALLMPPPLPPAATSQPHPLKRHHTRGSRLDVAGSAGAGPSCAGRSKAGPGSQKQDHGGCSSSGHHYSDQNTPPPGHFGRPQFAIHTPRPYRIPLSIEDLLAFIDANPYLANVCLKGISLPASSDMDLFTPSTTIIYKPPSSHPLGANTHLPLAPRTRTPPYATRGRGGSLYANLSPCLMGIYTPLMPALNQLLQQLGSTPTCSFASTLSLNHGEGLAYPQSGGTLAALLASSTEAKASAFTASALQTTVAAGVTHKIACDASDAAASKSNAAGAKTSTAAAHAKKKCYSLRGGPTSGLVVVSSQVPPQMQPAGPGSLPPRCPPSGSNAPHGAYPLRESGTPFGLISNLAHPTSASHKQLEQHHSQTQLLGTTAMASAIGVLSDTPRMAALADLYPPAPCTSPTFSQKVFLLGRDLPGRFAAYFELEAVALDSHRALWIVKGGRPAAMHQEW